MPTAHKQPDKRYNIDREYTGHPTPRHVVRFCDKMIGHCSSVERAEQLRDRHCDARDRMLRGEL